MQFARLLASSRFLFSPSAPDHTVVPYYLFGFRKFQHVLVWIKSANTALAERVCCKGLILLMPVALMSVHEFDLNHFEILTWVFVPALIKLLHGAGLVLKEMVEERWLEKLPVVSW